MSDEWGPGTTGDDDRDDVVGDHDGGSYPPPPPPPSAPDPWSAFEPQPEPEAGQAPVDPVLTLESESEVEKSSGLGGRAVAGIVGVLLLVGGTVFAMTQLGSSGPGSPEEAVADLLDAASDEDVLGLLAALDPGERDTLRQPVQDMFAEFERLEIVDSSFALDGIAGIDLEFDDVTYRTEPVRDDLVRVYFTGGTVSGSFKADELPIGDFVSDTLDRFEADISGVEESETSPITDDDTFLVARNGSDGWRVSIAYTAAEAARSELGLPLPASGISPIGADSPEAAVEGMLRATADLDLQGIIARLSPGELGALQEYAGLFIDEAAAELQSASADFEMSIDELSLRSDEAGDRASVFIEAFAVTISADGERLTVSTDGECFTLEGDFDSLELEGTPFADGPVCADDLEELSEEFFGQMEDSGFGDLGELGAGFPSLSTPEVGITTARIDGEWYVAPVATGLDGMVAVLEVLDREALDAIVDLVESVVTGFQQSFSDIGTSLDDFQDLEDLEDFGSEYEGPGDFEEFESEVPGQGGTGAVDITSLRRFVQEFSGGDEAFGDCLLSALLELDESTLFELGDAYEFEYEPSQETQQAFFGAVDVCQSTSG